MLEIIWNSWILPYTVLLMVLAATTLRASRKRSRSPQSASKTKLKHRMGVSENWKRLQVKQGKHASKKPGKPRRRKGINKESSAPSAPSASISPVSVSGSLQQFLWDTPGHNKTAPGKYIAMDCEFVGVGKNDTSALARVSLVNFYGHVLLDTFVLPQERVTNWRTWVSGVSPKDMKNAISFKDAQAAVLRFLNQKVLVGHALQSDLKCLAISHPRHNIRDTSKYSVFREATKGKPPSLRRLTHDYLNIDIQQGQHSSVEDARATMALYRIHKVGIDQAR